MREQILQMLTEAEGYLSGQEISRRLGVSRAAVWKNISALREAGYAIEAATNRGYRLTGCPDILDTAAVQAALGAHPWAERVIVLPTVDSTNTYAKKLAAEGAPQGSVVIADAQTGGRGRLGRSFASPAGAGVYLTALLRPQAAPGDISHLTAMAAVAACDAVETVCGLRPGIKWTNDLVVGKRKLAGILSELSVEWESGRTEYVVVGIGVNCNLTGEQFPEALRETATSLLLELGRPIRRAELAAALIRGLYAMSEGLLTEKTQWLRRYEADCVTVGQDVQICRGDSRRAAHADGIGENGELLVTYENGQREAVFSGEVSVRGMYGYV